MQDHILYADLRQIFHIMVKEIVRENHNIHIKKFIGQINFTCFRDCHETKFNMK